MSQSLCRIYVHLVFSTEHRYPFLQDKTIVEATHKYLGGACNKLDWPVVTVGGLADHVHILCRFGRRIEISDLVMELKRDSSKIGERPITESLWILVAKRLRRVLDHPIARGTARGLYRKPGGTSQEEIVSGGISAIIDDLRSAVGRTICLGLMVAGFESALPRRRGLSIRRRRCISKPRVDCLAIYPGRAD
ncbi:MAG: transposase [Schlesneria sp.]